MDKLSKLVDSTAFGKLSPADQSKYQKQDDGTYLLVGDDTPAPKDSKTLPLVVDGDAYAELPDSVRVFYDDKWADIDGNPGTPGTWKLRGFEDTTALKNAVGHVRAERDMARDKLKKFDGFDPDEYHRLKEIGERLEREKDLQRSEFDKQYTEASENYKREISLRDERIQKLGTNLERALIEKQAAIDITAADGEPELLLPHIKDRTQMQEVDGQYRAVILGEDGKPRLKKGATRATDFLSIREYVEELREDKRYAGAFLGTGSSGGGATQSRDTSGNSGASPATVSRDDVRAIGIHAESIAKGKTRVV